jgi:hypothetical protein
MKWIFTTALFSFLMAFSAQAKQFSTEFIEFELPPGWSCLLEGSEYVCQSENKDRKKEAIIILAAKKRGEQDSFEAYEAYLGKQKTYSIPGGKSQVSEHKYTKNVTINGHQWVDSLHLASEIPGFYTRYMATVKSDIGVAVTFSVAKEFYQDYNKGVFDRVIKSLRVFRQANLGKGKYKMKDSDEGIFDDGGFTFEDDDKVAIGFNRKKAKKDDKGGGDNTMYLIIGGVLIAFILMKLKK